MSGFFKPYEGARPFLFISYPHRNSDQVLATIRILRDRGFRLWYDEGIPAGSDWPANIARHVRDCGAVLFFLAERAAASPNCFSEIRTAARLGKPILVIRLDETALDENWTKLLEGRKVIPCLSSAEDRARAILTSGVVGRRFRHTLWERIPWQAAGLVLSVLLFLAAGTALGGLASGRWTPIPSEAAAMETPVPAAEPTPVPTVSIGEAEKYFSVTFPDAQQETAVRRALDNRTGEIQKWDLAGITELYFCGNMVLPDMNGAAFDPDGTCRVNGAPVITGKVSDLRLFPDMARLERLSLICQPLDDLSALSGHVLLRELSLAGSAVEDLRALEDLPSLEILDLGHTAVRDLTPLEALPGLRTVTVSRDMLPLAWSGGAAFAVVLAD